MAEGEATLLADAKDTAWHSDENAELVTQQGWKDPNDVIRDYSELQKSASDRIKMPTDESSPEEISAFYTKIGVPENPDGYEVKIPENIQMDDSTIGKLKQWAKEANAPKACFETVLKNYLDDLSNQVIQSRVDGEKVLKDEWKDDYEPNLELAKRFIANECSDEFKQLLEDTGMGNHPVFAKEYLRLAKKTMSDTLIKGDQKSGEKKDEYVPKYKDDPEMYRTGDDEDSQRARQWFVDHGHVY